MYKRHETGKYGEDLACKFLRYKNYEILVRNFKCKIGEIDIIAKDGEEIVFIEVKTRKQKRYGTPAESINIKKQQHIYFVAEFFLMINQMENCYCRIDTIEVYIVNDEVKINHIKNSLLNRPKVNKFLGEEICEE